MNPTNTTLDIILLVIVVVIGWRLWRTLGTRTGFERPVDPIVGPEPTKTSSAELQDLPPIWQNHAKEGSPLAKTLAAMADIDPGLDPNRFLEGAKIVHAKVLEAFSAGRLAEVATLVSPQVLETLQATVTSREQ